LRKFAVMLLLLLQLLLLLLMPQVLLMAQILLVLQILCVRTLNHFMKAAKRLSVLLHRRIGSCCQAKRLLLLRRRSRSGARCGTRLLQRRRCLVVTKTHLLILLLQVLQLRPGNFLRGTG
jgi:hypothetical protein